MRKHILPKATVEALEALNLNWTDITEMYRREGGRDAKRHPSKKIVRAVGYARMVLNVGPHEVAVAFSMESRWVSDVTRLNRLPDSVLDMLDPMLSEDRRLTLSDALCLSKMEVRDPLDYEKMAGNLLRRTRSARSRIRYHNSP